MFIFLTVFQIPVFSTKIIKTPEILVKFVENFVKFQISTISTA